MSAQLRLVVADNPVSWTEEDIKAVSRENLRVAMDMVTRKFRDRLFYHAMYIVKDHEEAYDVVQEVFIKAIRERRFYDVDFRMKAWLFRVTSPIPAKYAALYRVVANWLIPPPTAVDRAPSWMIAAGT